MLLLIYDPKYFLFLGTRMDVIRNVTVHDIYRARPALSECPHCQEMVTYRDHRDHCKARKKATAKDSELERSNSKSAIRSEVRIQVHEHKTGSTSKIGGH